MKHRILVALTATLLAISLSACEKEGPAEKAGKSVDEAASQAKQSMEDAGESLKQGAEEAKDKTAKMSDSLSDESQSQDQSQ